MANTIGDQFHHLAKGLNRRRWQRDERRTICLRPQKPGQMGRKRLQRPAQSAGVASLRDEGFAVDKMQRFFVAVTVTGTLGFVTVLTWMLVSHYSSAPNIFGERLSTRRHLSSARRCAALRRL